MHRESLPDFATFQVLSQYTANFVALVLLGLGAFATVSIAKTPVEDPRNTTLEDFLKTIGLGIVGAFGIAIATSPVQLTYSQSLVSANISGAAIILPTIIFPVMEEYVNRGAIYGYIAKLFQRDRFLRLLVGGLASSFNFLIDYFFGKDLNFSTSLFILLSGAALTIM